MADKIEELYAITRIGCSISLSASSSTASTHPLVYTTDRAAFTWIHITHINKNNNFLNQVLKTYLKVTAHLFYLPHTKCEDN